jgi:hypothetical protein
VDLLPQGRALYTILDRDQQRGFFRKSRLPSLAEHSPDLYERNHQDA